MTFVRAAAKADLGRIAELYVDSWRRTYRGLLPEAYLAGLDRRSTERKWADYRCRNGHFIFVSVEDQALKGFAAGMEASNVEPGAGLLDSMHVEADSRGHGIGKRLIGAVAGHLWQKGVGRMAITVIEGNDTALAVYEHLGARRIGHRLCSYGAAVREIVLRWDELDRLRTT